MELFGANCVLENLSKSVKSIKIVSVVGPIAISRRKIIAASRRTIIAVSRRKIIAVSRRKIIAVSRRKIIAVARRKINNCSS